MRYRSPKRFLRMALKESFSKLYLAFLRPVLKNLHLLSPLQRRLLKPYLRRPEEVDIEITSACNADCIMCPRKQMRRHQGPMDFDLFKKVVDEAIALKVKRLGMNGYGEISVLPNYRDYISYVRSKSSSVEILINSNGMRLDGEMAHFFVDCGVDLLNVTIDGATAATYESIRRNLKFEEVEANVKRLLQIRNDKKKKTPNVTVSLIAMPENQDETGDFLRRWQGIADRVLLTGLLSRIDSIPWARAPEGGWQTTPCFLLWNQMVVYSDGSVALCCDDWDGRGGFGNVRELSLQELWAGPKREGIRKLHLAGRATQDPLCGACRQPRPGPIWLQ